MVIATSESNNTLVSLENGFKVVGNAIESSSSQPEEFVRTELYLPADDFFQAETELEQFPIYLPKEGRFDEFFKRVPEIVESCDELLAYSPRVFTASSDERILYVAQGEVAHATPLQSSVLLSDKATTCHIIALRSESDTSIPLGSLAHIDSTSYEACIRAMFQEHVQHHCSTGEEKKSEEHLDDNRIGVEIHIVGGFEDSEETSSKISQWLLGLLATIADDERESMKLTLKTCAISSLNDNGYSCPIGRGLGIDLQTGDAFLAKAEDCATGPVPSLRSVRLWSGPKALIVIHTANSTDLRIEAFSYQPFPEVDQLLSLPDQLMLQYTSTSPDVEEPDFCSHVRTTLRFLRDVECTKIFGSNVDQTLIFRRTGNNNAWKQIQ